MQQSVEESIETSKNTSSSSVNTFGLIPSSYPSSIPDNVDSHCGINSIKDGVNLSNQHIYQKLRRFEKTLLIRRRLAEFNVESTITAVNNALRNCGLSPPKCSPIMEISDENEKYLLDRNKQSVYSEFLRRTKMQVPDFVRLLRGEVTTDTRPDKTLEFPTNNASWRGYSHRSRWHSIVKHGVIPECKGAFKEQSVPPPNHGSALQALNIIIKHLRAGQDANQYLILDLDLLSTLSGITCSPFGAVKKGEVELSVDARIIHDLSFPPGESVNDNTQPDTDIEVSYDGADSLSNRILDVSEKFPNLQRMLTGDVNGAFRHIPISAEHVGRFAGTIPEVGILVIDICCPFGWKNSPSSYWTAGAAISYLYSRCSTTWPLQVATASGPFDSKTWCDDHIAIEPNVGTRLPEAEIALRSAMVEVLGPDACNDKKFSRWFTQGRALGLDWDLQSLTVSMPVEKIRKALNRVNDLSNRVTATRTQVQQLLGSLRHVVTCIKSAAPFYQRVATLSRMAPRFGTIRVSEDAKDDLRWFKLVLAIRRLNGIPLSRFSKRHEPDYYILMDASDFGLCALFPARKQFLQAKYNDNELLLIQRFKETIDNDFCNNVRELMSAVFAAIVWGPMWHNSEADSDAHIRFMIDNTSAVSWNNKRSSRNPFAQMLLRILALSEVKHGFYTSAAHVAGVDNQIADAGSRVWQSPSMADRFSNLSCGWLQVPIPIDCRDLSHLWVRYCEKGL